VRDTTIRVKRPVTAVRFFTEAVIVLIVCIDSFSKLLSRPYLVLKLKNADVCLEVGLLGCVIVCGEPCATSALRTLRAMVLVIYPFLDHKLVFNIFTNWRISIPRIN
jgi:hypothetical protein